MRVNNMDRFTWKAPDGTYQIEDHNGVHKTRCYDEDFKNQFCIYEGKAIDKLGQYEDLGFTPEDIAYLAKFYKERTSAKAIADDMRVAVQLMEWAKLKDLEAEGRLVILPRKEAIEKSRD